MDEKWLLYKAMMSGRNEGRVSAFNLIKGNWKARQRWKEKNIEPSRDILKTDPWMKGGVLVFDRRGNLVYALEETPGEQFPMDRLERAIQGARNINKAALPKGAETVASASSTTDSIEQQ